MKTYEEHLSELLVRVPDDVDKSEASLIHFALASTAAALAEQDVYSANIFDATMPDTARGDEQTRIYKGFGLDREEAKPAVRKGSFTDMSGNPTAPPIGARFGADGLSYYVSSVENGEAQLTCETAGTIGNSYFGAILPLDAGATFGSATLGEVVIYGIETQDDELFRVQFYKAVDTRITPGNKAWYEQEISSLLGGGSVKVFPTPDGQGGRVHAVITAPGNIPASLELIQKVQNEIDPEPQGSGSGKAMIDHYVTISTVSEVFISIAGKLWIKTGYTEEIVLQNIRASIIEYLGKISFTDVIVRVALIESSIVQSEGVADAADVTINGERSNIVLSADWGNYQIPTLGELSLSVEG